MFLFSVLMSVYKNEKLCNLKEAMNSVLNQTILPNEIVIVKDGPLNEEAELYLDQISNEYDFIKFVNFDKNVGLGLALRAGVIACSNEFIARMDTDDIAKIDRFEKQINFLKKNPQISLLGTCIEEFSIALEKPDTKTLLPLTHDEIVSFSKKRNPFRHMTVMFKKSAVLECGNYRDFLWFEDYDLWVRMIDNGCKVANLPDILVSVRADKDMFARRGGWKYLKQDIKFQKFLLDIKYITKKSFFMNLVIRTIVRLIPNSIRNKFYTVFLRKRV